MDRKKIILQSISILAFLIFVGCSAAGTDVPPTPYPDEVDWETAVEILNNGEVEMIIQSHNLDVTLTMKDGSDIQTVEPSIDAIFAEIEKCGEPCSEILQVTE